MLRTGWLIIPAVILALLIGGAIGAAVTDNHDDRGDRVVQVTAPAGDSGQAPQVIRIDDDGGHWRHGFFPFGFLFPLLWIGLIILLISFFFRPRRGRGRWGGPGGWDDRMEDWHRRQHEKSGEGPAQPGAPAGS